MEEDSLCGILNYLLMRTSYLNQLLVLRPLNPIDYFRVL